MKTEEHVAIFWDQSCHPATHLSGAALVDNIRRRALQYGNITVFKTYISNISDLSISAEPTILRNELQTSGVTLVDVKGKTELSSMMTVDIFAFAVDNPSPATLILISGSNDFAYAASILRCRRYRVVVITPSEYHYNLKYRASTVLNWYSDVLGRDERDVVPSSRGSSSDRTIFRSPRPPSNPSLNSGSQTPTSVTRSQHQEDGWRVVETAVTDVGLTDGVPSPVDEPPPPSSTVPSSPLNFSSTNGHRRQNSAPAAPTSKTQFYAPTDKSPEADAEAEKAAFILDAFSATGDDEKTPTASWSGVHTQNSGENKATSRRSSVASSSTFTAPPNGWHVNPAVTAVTFARPFTSDAKNSRQNSPARTNRVSPPTSSVHGAPSSTHRPTAERPSPPKAPDASPKWNPNPTHENGATNPTAYAHGSTPSTYSNQAQTSPPQPAVSAWHRNPYLQYAAGVSSASIAGGSSTSANSNTPTASTSSTSKGKVPQHFKPLVDILRAYRSEGKPRPLRSVIGSELAKYGVYKKAGVPGFGPYIALAEEAGIVQTGSGISPGKEWLELCARWR
ncbi:hypothetical protein PLICRDRAFT_54561 [Plicaturopsis crispa FD-325 SS-3]|nr:hypothetical protein PLICRDRAFT_54561 [Plicaturopsis crispa FD-325 SS-3]